MSLNATLYFPTRIFAPVHSFNPSPFMISLLSRTALARTALGLIALTLVVSAHADTASVVTAANTLLSSSTAAGTSTSVQTGSYTLAICKQWTNLPGGTRNGPTIGGGPASLSTDLSNTVPSGQTLSPRAAAIALCQAALSSVGYNTMNEIRNADDVIRATDNTQSWNFGNYHIAILGTPSTTSAWMLQISGHHLTYNITYNAPYVSATPMFIGTEPPEYFSIGTDLTTSEKTVVVGTVNGTTTYFVAYPYNSSSSTTSTTTDPGISSGTHRAPLELQRAAVCNLADSIQADANVSSAGKLSGTFSDVVMGVTNSGDGNFPFINTTPTYPTGTTGRGVLFSSLNVTEQAYVRAMIEAWVNTQASDVSTSLLADYENPAALAQTYVGYQVGAGSADGGATRCNFDPYINQEATPLNSQNSYLRVDGPRVWIEMVVQAAVAFRNQSFVHYHSLWRDKLADYGNEFGGYLDTTSTSTTYTRPTITSQPASSTVGSGGSDTFSVTATGTAPLTYQWYQNSTAISGATGSSYTVSNAAGANGGSYYVVVSNLYGAATSSTAALTYASATPVITTAATLPAGMVGTAYTQTLAASGGTSPYTWMLASGSLPDGLSLSSAGVLAGTPNTGGAYSFLVAVTDNASNMTTATFSLIIEASPTVVTGAATAVGSDTTQATLNGTVNPNGYESTGWLEYGTTSSYGSTTRALSADTAESYSSWSYGTTGGTNLGAPTFLEGSSGGIFLANASTTSSRQIDGNESFAVYSSSGTQAMYRVLASPQQVGEYTLSARFDLSNATAFTGFNIKSAPGATFGANEMLSFGLLPAAGSKAIYVHGSTYQIINLGTDLRGSIINFKLDYDTVTGAYTLGAKLSTSTTYTSVSGTLESYGSPVADLGFGNFNSGTTQNLIFDDLSVGASPSLGSGTAPVTLSSTATGLTANTTYHFRAVGQNSAGTVYGADQSFATNIVTVAASAPDAYEEGPTAGDFTITQTGSASLPVAYNLGGTAALNSRYTIASSPFTLAAGSTSGMLAVTPIPNDQYDGDQTVVLTLAAGNYLIGGTGTATVTIHDKPFDAWKYANFGSNANNAAISGPLADPDGDGIPNLIEYALNRTPTVPDATSLLTLGSETDISTGLNYLTASYSRRISAPDITYYVDVSSDLVTWNSGSAYTTDESVTADGNSVTETVKVRILSSTDQNPRMFVRLRISQP